MSTYIFVRRLIEERLERRPLEWFRASAKEVGESLTDARFSQLFAVASRHVKNVPLGPTAEEIAAGSKLVEGLSVERWSLLEAVRVGLILSRGDLAEESGAVALSEIFRYADEGELCALYRSFALLPEAHRFLWQAGEGCRTNMKTVFEATALDTPYPAQHFEDPAWRQVVIKCIFIESPLWRLQGLDGRLSAELARMALDLADERRSAGRDVQHELWLCLGAEGGKRAVKSLELELSADNPNTLGRRAAAYGLARAGKERLLRKRADADDVPLVLEAIRDALAGPTDQSVFRRLDPHLA